MKKKILVVEDNECNRRLVTDILRHFGYTVAQATDGSMALKMVEKYCPDLILMDMQMPVMDGFEAIKQLRNDEKTSGIKIIAVTSFAMAEEKERILATGVDQYIAKPIDTRKLPKIVKKMIG
jgi:two-component system, cell cycle response regulator DivK